MRMVLTLLCVVAGCGDPAVTIDAAAAQPDLSMVVVPRPDLAMQSMMPDFGSGACLGTAESCGGADGGCVKCPTAPNATATCTGGVCGSTCNPGAALCNLDCRDLTIDQHNCGACGHSCLGGNCNSGACEPDLLGELLQCMSVAVDAYSVYFTDVGDGTIYALSLIGGGLPGALAKNQGRPGGVAVDAKNVYWTDSLGGTVMARAIMNGNPTALATGQLAPADITTDGQFVYWVNAGAGTVMKVASAGGANPVQLATGQNGPSRIALDGANVYWTNKGDGSVAQVSVAGGNVVVLATGQALPAGIAVDAKSVYWVNAGDGTVRKVPIGGGAAPTVLAVGQSTPHSIAVDGSGVYWTNFSDGFKGSVMRLPPNANAPVMLGPAPPPNGPTGIALDAISIFYVDKTTGIVWRQAK